MDLDIVSRVTHLYGIIIDRLRYIWTMWTGKQEGPTHTHAYQVR